MNDTLFAPEAGHPEIQEKILSSLLQNRFPHAYLFYGPEGCGKEAFALSLAQLLNSSDQNWKIDRNSLAFKKIAHFQHPDVTVVFPTPVRTNVKEEELAEARVEKAQNPYRRISFPGKNTFIGIDEIRELKSEARYKLYEGKKKVFIITEAEQMRVEAANALLKLLEEPPDNLLLILTTSNIYRILPTIKSRCQMLRFGELPEELIAGIVGKYIPGADTKELPLIARLAGYNIKKIFEFLDKDVLQLRETAIDFLRKVVMIQKAHELLSVIEPVTAKKDREDARLFLWFLLLWFHDLLHIKKMTENKDRLYNFDKLDTLKKFNSFTPNADIQGIVWELEDAVKDLNDVRNFNPLLIFSTLAIKLHKKIRTR